MSKRIINDIKLSNWFNYKGGFDKNEIKFNNGVNILVGDNNAGKSKLHNALRWVLSDEVVLEQNEGAAVKSKIKESNFRDIINQSYFEELKDGSKIDFGVEVTFTQVRDVDSSSKTYVLTKIVKAVRDSSAGQLGFRNFEIDKKVYILNRRTNQKRSLSEDFDSIAHKLISPMYQNFFLIEGEQLGLMTPLEGSRLKETVNNLVNIHELDYVVNRSARIKIYAADAKDEIEATEESISENRKEALERIKELRAGVNELKKEIPNWEEERIKYERLKKKYEDLARNSEEKKRIKDEFDQIERSIKTGTENKDEYVLEYLKGICGLPDFSLSRLMDDNSVIESINDQIGEIDSMISERRTEIDSKLSKRQQKMIMKLEKSQPRPVILSEMVEVGHCFVCDSEMDENSKDYIRNILIPFFEGETEDDEQLDKLNLAREFLRSITMDVRNYVESDLEVVNRLENNVIAVTSDLLELQSEKDAFIERHGVPEEDESNAINITTYLNAVRESDKAKQRLEEIESEIKDSEREIDTLSKNTSDSGQEESDKFKKIKKLSLFIEELNSSLSDIKNEKYKEFVAELETKATERYQQFMAHNVTSNNQRIQVKKIDSAGGNVEFSVNVVDEYGNISKQGGGADQALRRVALVFGLLDYAENKNGYPFIADAPVSKLSPDTKLAFFETIANDEALNQSIILTMDLWSSKNKGLNEIGESVKNLVSNLDGGGFKLIRPIGVNQGVEIEDLM